MNKKYLVDFIISLFLIICGSMLLIFPLFDFFNVKVIFMLIIGFYGSMNLIKYFFTTKRKDIEGILVAIASIITLIITWRLDIMRVSWYLSLVVFIWIILMSFIKLRKFDHHDMANKLWILEVIPLILFVLSGLLIVINLYYSNDIQVMILGFFCFIEGILELLHTLMLYLVQK